VRARRRGDQLLITDAIIEGVRATVVVDTGSQASIGNLALRDNLRAKRSEEVTTMDVNGGSLIGDMSRIRFLSIEGIGFRDIALTFADTPAFEALGRQDTPVVALGIQQLRMFDRVAVDFSHKRVLFDVPREVARELRRKRFGRP